MRRTVEFLLNSLITQRNKSISSEWVLTTEGDVRTCIVADITNGDDLSMFGLDELVDTCYSKLDAFALKHKCY